MNIGTFLLTTLANGLIAATVLLVFFWIFKVAVFGHEFREVLREKGVSGGALVLCAYIIGLSIVVAAAGF